MMTSEFWRKVLMATMLIGLISQILVFILLGLGLKLWAVALPR
jgi:hypothetical protein